MNSKRLDNDSLKMVIEYMDPHTRFLLSSRIPSISVLDRAIPLKIGRLVIGDHFIKVNETEYKYEIYQVDCKDEIPYRVSGECKLNGRWTCDVDEFGIRDYITKAGLPGNNGNQEKNLFGFNDLENIPTEKGHLEKLKRILITEKQRYDQLLCYRPENVSESKKEERESFEKFKAICHDLVYSDEELELLRSEKFVNKAIENTDERIKQMENELLPFENRRNNIRPKFEIHVVVKRKSLPRVIIERIVYISTGDLHKAGESLMEFMFSKRQNSVVVNQFEINQKCHIRMPSDLKMRIGNLELKDNISANLELVEPIIDKTSFKKGILTICCKNNEEIDYKLIAKFSNLVYSDDSSLALPLVQRFQNNRVYFLNNAFLFFENDDFIFLLKNWLKTDKPMGTCFTFPTFQPRKDYIKGILKDVRYHFNEATKGDKCVDIPMRNSTALRMSYKLNDSRYLIILTVVPV
uniref:BRCA-2_OB1 domain-containing protein n=1 Tax=Caenorhabditis tropicalis TaxID=1561998 RepID=A0A1I7T3S4_9PELO